MAEVKRRGRPKKKNQENNTTIIETDKKIENPADILSTRTKKLCKVCGKETKIYKVKDRLKYIKEYSICPFCEGFFIEKIEK